MQKALNENRFHRWLGECYTHGRENLVSKAICWRELIFEAYCANLKIGPPRPPPGWGPRTCILLEKGGDLFSEGYGNIIDIQIKQHDIPMEVPYIGNRI